MRSSAAGSVWVAVAAAALLPGALSEAVYCGEAKITNGKVHDYTCSMPGPASTMMEITGVQLQVRTWGTCNGGSVKTGYPGAAWTTYSEDSSGTWYIDLDTDSKYLTYGGAQLPWGVKNLNFLCDMEVTLSLWSVPLTPTPTSAPPMPAPTSTPAPPIPAPMNSSSLCPARVGNAKLKVSACGAADCRTSQRVPLGEPFELCDPCAAGPLGVQALAEKEGSGYRLTITVPIPGGTRTVTVDIPKCGQCVTYAGNSVQVDCESDSGVSVGVIVGAVVGSLALVGIAGAGALWWVKRRRTASEEGLLLSGEAGRSAQPRTGGDVQFGR